MHDSPWEEKGALCSYLADSKPQYNGATGLSRGILSAGSASSPGNSNTATGGVTEDLAITAFLSRRGAVTLQGVSLCSVPFGSTGQLSGRSFNGD